jgi:2-polyprenyl-6-hydroxyphenyl methylase/3-demethylubiquinone-9 3-methyltransferase
LTLQAKRFEFGENWAEYLRLVSENALSKAQRSFEEFTGLHSLKDKIFLDLGCGSGIHSLVAYRLEADRIVSFDYDSKSVETCRQLQSSYAPDVKNWTIIQGDVLDKIFLGRLGMFDYVYSWGVLHHTGHMWDAIQNAQALVKPDGFLHLAIYNKHWTSWGWKNVKALYVRSPKGIQSAWLALYVAWEWTKLWVRHRGGTSAWIDQYSKDRGMLWRTNLRDWLGGYPYEYATVPEVTAFLLARGFKTLRVAPNHGTGCSEYLFQRMNAHEQP